MNVEIYQLLEGAKNARGLTVIIDVFRAFTTACYIMNNGAETIIPVGDVNIAYDLKKSNNSLILLGERNEVMLPGFDFGNSPANIEFTDFKFKTVVHTTSAGTQGIANANNADEIITGSLVNAPAVARYIKSKNPKNVSLVCMGKAALAPTDEDTFCAEYIKSILESNNYDLDAKIKTLRYGEGKRFFNTENQIQCPERDFYLSTQIGKFDFVLKAETIPKLSPLCCLKKILIN